ncbi:DUF58 domain-containing protein [Guptibacillus algicola]|uniref:DUF58 domain-containing protein n=1 Tax=Guptibacillus algicola TaxID=225844 RepID=UPI001CD5F7E1|nr:DUF58 domain-containing protein [Alkalihalobacillus algicola]MCA0989057.1 DUF58 domain-containing protein [Alkalihalobacillus algicola]
MMLSPRVIQRLPKHRIQSTILAKGTHRGERKSTKLGTSLEFSDYRLYSPGDDLRQIDWNAYARTKRHYIKRFMDEQELLISIYLDATSSVVLDQQKRDLAQSIAGAFGYMGLCGDDRVSLHPIGDNVPSFQFRKGRAYSSKLLSYIASLNHTGERATQSFMKDVIRKLPKKSGLSIIISDFMEPLDDIKSSLKRLQAQRQQVRLIQVLTEDELNPRYSGDLKLIDSENLQETNVSMNKKVLDSYRKRLSAHQHDLRRFCSERGIGMVTCSASDEIENVMFRDLRKKGWIL